VKNPKWVQKSAELALHPIVQEPQANWDQNEFALFHGTSMENAIKLSKAAPLLPILDQASEFLQTFGLELDGITKDEDFSTMAKYIFQNNRDETLSTASRFKLARNYALRLPEWQWYLFRHIHKYTGSTFGNFQHWQDMAEEYAKSQPNPAVMVIRSPVPVSQTPHEFLGIDNGSEIKISNPMPSGFSILEIVEIDRRCIAGDNRPTKAIQKGKNV